MNTQINKELAALMQLDSAEQAIKTLLRSGVAPGTIAAQKVQQTAALTQAAPQATPPSGIERVLPGVGVQAAMSAQAAQPATQGDVNQLRQMMAQQGRGVAQLPGADVEMAEGGIVGYNGQTGSFISNLSMEEIERMSPDMRKAYFKEMLARRNAPVSTPAAPVTPPAASIRPGVGIAGALAKKLGPLGLLAELFTTSDEDIALLQKAEAERNATPADSRPRGQENYEQLPPVVAPDVAEAMRSGYARFPGSERGRGNTRVAQTPDGSAQRVLAAANVKPADAGIASLMGPPVPSGSERQFAESLSVLGRTVDPTKRTPEQIEAERLALYRARGIEPGKAEQERIAKLEAFDAQEEAARNKRIEKRGMQDLITFLTGFGGAPSMVAGGRRGSEASAQLQQGWERSDEAYNLLKRQRMDAIAAERVALANRNQALADGDIATAAREAEALRTAQNARLMTEAKMRADFAVPMMQAETAAAQIAASAKEGAANRANQVLVAKLQLSKPSDLQERVALLSKDPAKFKQIYGDKTAVDLAELRAKLLADYSKNAMQLQTQNINSFDDYLALFGQSAITPGGASTPPPGAVREKGK